MRMLYAYLFPALWVAYLAFWQIMAVNVKATQRNEPARSRITRAVVFLSAVVLLSYGGVPLHWLNWPLWPERRLTFWVGAAITAAGLLFSIWARLHLGRNWSRSVTIKEDHELIVTGPYALVRHPIYTGLLTGFLGTAIAVAKLRGALAFVMIFLSLWAKLRLEERWMRDQFGASYQAYSGRVAALVPFLL
jgi:protein-S-isoprenylcysteine O-methyltransferase Ste14